MGMNSEEDEFRRIEREAKRRAQDDDDDTQGYTSEFVLKPLPKLREFLNELNDRIVRRYQGSDKDQDIAYGMEIVYVDLIDLIEGKK
jgi:predicted HTH domain antitoxin